MEYFNGKNIIVICNDETQVEGILRSDKESKCIEINNKTISKAQIRKIILKELLNIWILDLYDYMIEEHTVTSYDALTHCFELKIGETNSLREIYFSLQDAIQVYRTKLSEEIGKLVNKIVYPQIIKFN